MTSADPNWDNMLENARLYQQQYYELLPEWTKYQQHEYKYLWQNIGFALFGPPAEEGKNITMQDKCDLTDAKDVTDLIFYGAESKTLIDIIYKKILKFNNSSEGCIYYGVIYNITFRTKHDPVTTDKSKNVDKDKELDINLDPVPIFKLKRQIQDKTNNSYEVWYIDAQGRTYQNWKNYKECNTLRKCTMVIPENGIYQLDPNCKATEEYSTVWLDIAQSPACNTKRVVLSGIDTASSAAGIVGLGLCIATIFTPAAPVVMSATVLSALNGIWSFGRSTQNLVDKRTHKESLTDKNAFCSWLAISGSTLGLATTGGTSVITKLVEKGSDINKVAKFAYNTVLLSNLGVNGVGIGFQAYCMYEKYQSEQKISKRDVISLTAHLLFFGNTVSNLKYAAELIETTQGRVLEDYKATLRSRHLRKAYNRAKRNAAENNTNKAAECAEVIRYINRKLSFSNQTKPNNTSAFISNIKQIGGKIIIEGITLLDPNKFVDILITADKNSSSEPDSNENMYEELKCLLQNLLKSVVHDTVRTDFPEIHEFFKDMNHLENGLGTLTLIFKIAVTVMQYSPSCKRKMREALHFVWNYVKQSVQQAFSNINFSIEFKNIQKKINEIILALFEEMQTVAQHLGPAFEKYCRNSLL